MINLLGHGSLYKVVTSKMHKIRAVLTCPYCHHHRYLDCNSFRIKSNYEDNVDSPKKQHANHESTTSTSPIDRLKRALSLTCKLKSAYLDSLRPALPSDEQLFSFDIKTISCWSENSLSWRRQRWQKFNSSSRKLVHDASTCHVCSMTQRVGNCGISFDPEGLGQGYDENFTHYTCNNFHFSRILLSKKYLLFR